jgi:ketopantoate reductase
MTTIAIIGPGAVGLGAGAALTDNGHAVTFVGRQRFDLVTIETEEGVFSRHMAKSIVDEAVPKADWVLVCTKAHQTPAAAGLIRAAVGADTRVATLQNGIEHAERLAGMCRRRRRWFRWWSIFRPGGWAMAKGCGAAAPGLPSRTPGVAAISAPCLPAPSSRHRRLMI